MSEQAALEHEELPFVIRAYDEATDKHYVLDSWLKSRLMELAGKHQRRMSIRKRHDWFAATRPRFAAILLDPAVNVLIACDPDRTRTILGWLVYQPDTTDEDASYAHVAGWASPARELILSALRRASEDA